MARPRKNNADYFSHDKDMRNNLKIKALRQRFGNEGYALWSYLLEVLTDSDNFEFFLDEIGTELLAADFGVSPVVLAEFLDFASKLGLIFYDKESGLIYSESLKSRLAQVIEKREKNREIVKKRWSKIDKNEKIVSAAETIQTYNFCGENNTNVEFLQQKPYERIISSDKTIQSKVKESKVKKSKVNNILDEQEYLEKKENIDKLYFPKKDLAWFVSFWNEEFAESNVPKVQHLTEQRQIHLLAKIKEWGGFDAAKEKFKAIVDKIKASDFLQGVNGTNWTVFFDWVVMYKTNWVKVLEGNFDNKTAIKAQNKPAEPLLGVGEYMRPDGTRTYGTGRFLIPLEAEPRPSDQHIWSNVKKCWIYSV